MDWMYGVDWQLVASAVTACVAAGFAFVRAIAAVVKAFKRP